MKTEQNNTIRQERGCADRKQQEKPVRTRIKICGLTRLEDIQAVNEAKSIAYCTVADSFSFKFLHSRDLRRSSFASRCQDHTAGFKIAFRCFHLKGIKASHSHDLGIQDPDTKCPGLFKSSFKKFFSGKRFLKSVIILDLLCFFQ